MPVVIALLLRNGGQSVAYKTAVCLLERLGSSNRMASFLKGSALPSLLAQCLQFAGHLTLFSFKTSYEIGVRFWGNTGCGQMRCILHGFFINVDS